MKSNAYWIFFFFFSVSFYQKLVNKQTVCHRLLGVNFALRQRIVYMRAIRILDRNGLCLEKHLGTWEILFTNINLFHIFVNISFLLFYFPFSLSSLFFVLWDLCSFLHLPLSHLLEELEFSWAWCIQSPGLWVTGHPRAVTIKSALILGCALPLSPALNGIILAWQMS